MKRFQYFSPTSIDAVTEIFESFGNHARFLAGGTDLFGQLKNQIYSDYPEALVSIRNIPDLVHITEAKEGANIGALTTLKQISDNNVIATKYPALAQAAKAAASPQLRSMGTVGGNICQNIRCWYYRAPQNYFYCLRKAGAPKGSICYAVKGDNRFHAIFGPVKRCFAVHPSDLSPALIALQARFKTSRRIMDAGDFFAVRPDQTTVLEPGEILMEIQLPRPRRDIRSSFLKFSLRNCIDFPIVNCAISIRLENGLVQSAIICLNGVYNVPFRAKKAEQYLVGREITDGTVEAAGELAVFGARPLAQNKYMVFIAADLVKKALLGCAEKRKRGIQYPSCQANFINVSPKVAG